jgi:hypothetical protein
MMVQAVEVAVGSTLECAFTVKSGSVVYVTADVQFGVGTGQETVVKSWTDRPQP